MSASGGLRGRVWLDGAFRAGWVAWERGRITEARAGSPPRRLAGVLQAAGRLRIAPGFVDTLLHGFAGHGSGTAEPEELFAMAAALARAGVTSAWCGFYPLPPAELRAAARRWDAYRSMRGRTVRCRLLGWHLEGPFLPRAMLGALPAAGVQAPSAARARRLAADCGGWLRMATLAPELRGARAAAAELRAARVRISIGHTAAGWEHCAQMAEDGDVALTHLGNRMKPLAARAPGPIGFALAGRARWVGVIPDGVHVAPATLRLLARTPALAGRLMFTSDNLAHAGLPARDFRAGGKRLRRDGPVARDSAGGLAGTLDALPELLARRVAEGTLDIAEVLAGGAEVPGALVGRCGRLAPGLRADLVCLAADGRVARSWVGGREAAD